MRIFKSRLGFTLAELLVALSILGVIATFTIPKLLNASTQGKRMALAKETLGTLSGLNDKYLLINGGCYPGLSCRLDASGNSLDSGVIMSEAGIAPTRGFNQMVSFLDSNLNYVEKYVDAGDHNVYYQLANKVVIGVYGFGSTQTDDTHWDMAWMPDVWVDATLGDVLNDRASSNGVDTVYFYPYLFRNRLTLWSNAAWAARTNNAYFGPAATMFDIEDHPGDTCAAVGGLNCGF